MKNVMKSEKNRRKKDRKKEGKEIEGDGNRIKS